MYLDVATGEIVRAPSSARAAGCTIVSNRPAVIAAAADLFRNVFTKCRGS
jgi:hypothetical protein